MDVDTIQKTLEKKFNVIHVWVEDDSARHRTHKQSQGKGGHFNVLIVSNDFENMKLIDRHRKIYEAIGLDKAEVVHAMGVQAWTEKEWKEKNVASS